MSAVTSIEAAIQWLKQALTEIQTDQSDNTPVDPTVPSGSQIAWGSRVSPTFRERVRWTASALGCDANDLMACIAWESGETFRSDIKNAAGSGAVGLIQFMPSTARALGTTSNDLSSLSPESQLKFVYEYFKPFAGRLHNLGDVYMAILWPKGVGKSDDFILFDRSRTPTTFRQNAGLDVNKDGAVTRGECLVKIRGKLAKGLLPENIG